MLSFVNQLRYIFERTMKYFFNFYIFALIHLIGTDLTETLMEIPFRNDTFQPLPEGSEISLRKSFARVFLKLFCSQTCQFLILETI